MFIQLLLLWERYSFTKDELGGNKMIFNKTYGHWSTIVSVFGTLLLMATYIPNNPEKFTVIIMIMLVLAIILLVSGIILSILAIKNNEVGTKKYIGILLPVLIILFIVLVPFLMAVGFLINDNP